MLTIEGFDRTAGALAAVLALVLPGTAQAQSLIANGSFESGYDAWTPSGPGSVSLINTVQASDGTRAMAFSGSNAILSQQFTSGSGVFDFRFDAGRSEGFGPFDDVPLTFVMKIDDTVLSSDLPLFDPASGARPDATRLLSSYFGSVALAAGTHTLTFEFSRGSTLFARDPFVLVDNVSLAAQANGAVPEPSTWALLILGFGVVGAGMRRRASVAYA